MGERRSDVKGSRYLRFALWACLVGFAANAVLTAALVLIPDLGPEVRELLSIPLGTAAVFATLAAALYFGPILRTRRMRAAAEEALGIDLDLERLRKQPVDLDRVRDRIVSVGLVPTGQDVATEYGEYQSRLTQVFVVTDEGDDLDVAVHRDSREAVADALWLARQLQIPLMDGRTSFPHTFMPEELEELDEDLVRSESESESEPVCRTTESESESESEPAPESESEPEPEPEPEEHLDRARRAARARQRS